MGTPGSPVSAANQLDVVLDGTWVIVPRFDSAKNVVSIDLYSPTCGHPQGVAYANAPNPDPKPNPSSYYMLDTHSHTLQIQRTSGISAGLNLSSIPTTVNHCVSPARPIGGNWDLLVSISAGPDTWTSSGPIIPEALDPSGKIVRCFSGNDAPSGSISSTQVLTFNNVANVSLLGAPAEVQALWPTPWKGAGSLLFEDEIPYIPTLQHERMAIFAMANLAGLDLALDYPLPKKSAGPAVGGPIQPRMRVGGYCGHAVVVLPLP